MHVQTSSSAQACWLRTMLQIAMSRLANDRLVPKTKCVFSRHRVLSNGSLEPGGPSTPKRDAAGHFYEPYEPSHPRTANIRQKTVRINVF